MAEARWKSGQWIWALWVGVPVVGVALWQLLAVGAGAFAEGGIVEWMQVGVWGLACVSAVVVATRISHGPSRWGTVLLGVLSVVALARELDAHIALNPQRLGSWGVRYRLDWWMDGSVPVALKLGWAFVALVGLAAVSWIVLRARQPMRWDLVRLRLVVVGAALLFVGFTCDDLLRGRVPIEVAQVIEEMAELVGALVFLAAVLAPESAEAGFVRGARARS